MLRSLDSELPTDKSQWMSSNSHLESHEAHQQPRASWDRLRVVLELTVERWVPRILHPFPDFAVNIVNTESILIQLTHGMGALT